MHEIWALVNEMSPYLLLGFAFAGLLHSFVPASLYRRYLGKNSFSSVIWAALLGVPLPLCSCPSHLEPRPPPSFAFACRRPHFLDPGSLSRP